MVTGDGEGLLGRLGRAAAFACALHGRPGLGLQTRFAVDGAADPRVVDVQAVVGVLGHGLGSRHEKRVGAAFAGVERNADSCSEVPEEIRATQPGWLRAAAFAALLVLIYVVDSDLLNAAADFLGAGAAA